MEHKFILTLFVIKLPNTLVLLWAPYSEMLGQGVIVRWTLNEVATVH